MRRTAIPKGAAILLALASPGLAIAAPQTYDYVVTHSRYGVIGDYDRTIEQTGGITRAQSRLTIAVKVLGIVVHRENADQTEVWRGPRLISFNSVTTSNGKPLKVSGEARDNGFWVTTPAGTAIAPADVAASDPWGFSRTGPSQVVSIKSGKIEPVNVIGGETETLLLRGVAVPVRHFRVSTARQPDKWDVWLDAQGVPIKFRSLERGGTVDFTLNAPPNAGGAPSSLAMVASPRGPDTR